MQSIYLVRHAHSIWTPDEDRPLSAGGFEAAWRVDAVLKNEPIQAIFASSSRRAWQTVAPLSESLSLPINLREDLVERVLTDQALDDFFAAVRWTWDHPEKALPGGESNLTAKRRGVLAVQQILQEHTSQGVVIGTHGNLLALVASHYLPALGYDFWFSLSMPDIYRLDIQDGEPVIMTRLWEAADAPTRSKGNPELE